MNKKFLFAMALPLVFTACSQEELVNEAPNQNVKAEGISGLALNIAKEDGSELGSRATMNSDNVLTFEKDDNVSLYWMGNDALGNNTANAQGLSNAVYYTEDGEAFQSKSVVYEGYNLLTYPADLAHVSAKTIDVKLPETQNPADYIKNWVYVGDSVMQIHLPVETTISGTKYWQDPLYGTIYGKVADYPTVEDVIASNVSGYNKGLNTGMKPLQTDLHLTLRLKNVPAGANVVVNKVVLESTSAMFSTEGYITPQMNPSVQGVNVVAPNTGSRALYLNPWYSNTNAVPSVGVDCSAISVQGGQLSVHMLLNPIVNGHINIDYAADGTPTYSLDASAGQPVLKVYTNYGIVTIGGSAAGTNNQTRVIFQKNGTTAAAATDNEALLAMVGVSQRYGFTKVGTTGYRVKNKGWYVPRVIDVDMNNADIDNMHVKNNAELNAILTSALNLPTPPATLNVYLDANNDGQFVLTDLSVLNSYNKTLNLIDGNVDGATNDMTQLVVNTTSATTLPNLNIVGADEIVIPATSAITTLKAGSSSALVFDMPIVNKKTTGLTVPALSSATIKNVGAVLNAYGTIELTDNTNGTVYYKDNSELDVDALITDAMYGKIAYTATNHAKMKLAMEEGVNEVTIENINLGFFSEAIETTVNTYPANNQTSLGINVIFNNCGDLKDLNGGITAATVSLKGGTKCTDLSLCNVTTWKLYDTTTFGKTLANTTTGVRDNVYNLYVMGGNATINGVQANNIKVYRGATANITAHAYAPVDNMAIEGTATYAATGAVGTISKSGSVYTVSGGLTTLVVTGNLTTNKNIAAQTVYLDSTTRIVKSVSSIYGVGAVNTVKVTKYEQIRGTANFFIPTTGVNESIWSGATTIWDIF